MLAAQQAFGTGQLFVTALLGASNVWSDWKVGPGYFVAKGIG